MNLDMYMIILDKNVHCLIICNGNHASDLNFFLVVIVWNGRCL